MNQSGVAVRTRVSIAAAVNLVEALCVLVVTVVIVRHEAIPRATPAATDVKLSQGQWKQALSNGHWLAADSAPVTIVEFADFQCPACRQFATTTLPAVMRMYQGEIAVLFRQWPLSYHTFAMPAARASECAAAVGHFAAFYDTLYAHQDSLGRMAFQWFAMRAGITDTAGFDQCLRAQSHDAAIAADVQEALDLKGVGTPTILVNGLKLGTVPDSARLAAVVGRALRNER